MDTYIVAGTQPDGSKVWLTSASLQAAFITGSDWRATGVRDITVAVIVPYTATIQIVADGQTIELPIPDVPS